MNKDIIVIPQRVSFQQAQALCRNRGYQLVKIDNEQFNVLIYNLAIKYGIGRYWIDANDIQTENSFVYSDGRRITYHKFASGEPNNYQNEDCIHGLFYSNALWNDIRCDDPNAVICYKEVESTTSRSYAITVSNKKLVLYQTKATFAQAQTLCKNIGYKVVQITDDNFNAIVYNLALQYQLGRYWIDANDIQTEGNFVYSDGKKITYQKFAPNEPNNFQNEDCVHGLFYSNALWNDIKCEDSNAVICLKEPETQVSITIKLTNKHLFILQSKASFIDAQLQCKNMGYRLIKIDDEKFNIFVYNLALQYQLGRYWIDANDMKTEGMFLDYDGNRIKYSKFPNGEPNNYQNEDCVHGMFYRDAFWNDFKCDDLNTVICYKEVQIVTLKPVKLMNREVIYFQEKTTFQKAQDLCKVKGYELVKIDDDQFNTIVYNFAIQNKLGRYWIDANDIQTEGAFVYSNGKRIIYSKFQSGEPNNYQDEDCIHGLYYANGLWNDIKCDDLNAVICSKDLRIDTSIRITIGTSQLIILQERTTFDKAQLLCRNQGYQLLKIDNDQSNTLVYNMAVQNRVGRYWIDANDIRTEGRFEHWNGNKVAYSKFAKGEPNNYLNEDCVHGLYYENGFWNDIKCHDNNAVICYKEIGSGGSTKIEITNLEILIYEEKIVFVHAQSLCRSKGYELIKIDNDKMNMEIYEMAVKYNIGTYWIDANDIRKEGSFVYSDDNEISYNKFAPNEPNNYENEDCVHGLYYKDGLWNDIKCDYKNAVICSKKSLTTEETTPKLEERYHIHTVLVTYQEAINFCNKHHCQIVKITDENTNKIIYHFAKKLNIGRYWINGNDIVTEGKWVDTAGNKLTYLNWQKGEPNNYWNEDCMQGNYYPDGKWNDIACESKNYLIYEFESKAEKEITIEITNEKTNYEKALSFCKSRGYNLIRIDSEEINKLVNDIAVKGKIGQYWIDANDIQTEGKFVYSDGKDISYRNFAPGEPNNKPNEDCVHGLFYPNGLWNDIGCDSVNSVICYKGYKEEKNIDKKKEEIDISKYFIHTVKVTYEEALNYCQLHNCRLVKITSAEIDIMILNLVRKYKIGGYWLDGNDIEKEGYWVDIEGKKLTYLNWHVGEPNNYANEDCLQGNYYSDGKWNDISCKTKNAFVYYYEETTITSTELEIYTERVTFEEAQNFCTKKGYSLIRIDNEEMNQKIYQLALGNKIGQYWIDANDIKIEGRFVDSNGNSLKYSKFPQGEPNNRGNEDCVHGLYYSDGFWNDISCNSKNSFICTKYSPVIIFIDEHTSYEIYIDKVTYKEALDKCKSDGFSLIKIDNIERSQIIHQLSIKYKLDSYWIEGTDTKSDGAWLFSDGQPITYTNWLQSNTLNKNQDCIYTNQTFHGKWLGTACNSKQSTICYKPSKEIISSKVTKKIKYYLHETAVTYKEALNFCNEKLCQLVIVDNIDTDKYIWELAKKMKVGKYWMNGNDIDKEGEWVDSNNNKLIYLNWYKNEPNNYKNENCLQGNYYPEGKWNDISCDDKNAFFFEMVEENQMCQL